MLLYCPSGIRHVDGAKLNWAFVWNVRTWPVMVRENGVFFINLPVAAAVVAITARHVPETKLPVPCRGWTSRVPPASAARWPGSPTG